MRVLSPSQIESWLRCRLRWHYSSERLLTPKVRATPAMAVGTAVHDAYEQFYLLPPADRALVVLESNVVRAWAETCANEGLELEADDFKQYERRTLGCVRNLWAEVGADASWYPVEAEKVLEIEVGPDVRLSARADLVIHRDDEVLIDDLKTSSKAQNPTTWLRWHLQFRLLALAAYDIFRKPVRISCSILYPTVRRDGAGLDRKSRLVLLSELVETRELVKRIAAEMDKLDRVPTETTACVWCPYSPICETRLLGGDVEEAIRQGYVTRERAEIGGEIGED